MEEDFVVETNESGRQYVTFAEGMTKNHHGGLNYKPRLIHPKMFVTGGERCPVMLLSLYKSKRPIELRNKGPFYLGVIDKPKVGGAWFKKSPMGVHTIDNFVKASILLSIVGVQLFI